MVLLHRLSSLNYKERQFDFSSQAMILTPNDQFTLHIKGLADELQIGNIHRASVEQYYIDTLLLYDQEFKLDGKVSSEMFVRQDYVDYIYSDQFLKDFDAAYQKIIAERNAYAEILDNLTEAMGQPARKIDFDDDTQVVSRIRMGVMSMDGFVQRKESEIAAAEDAWKKLENRKKFLEERVPKTQEFSGQIVGEALPRVYTKVAALLNERQHNIEALEEELRGLQAEHDRVQGTILMFGKRAKLEELDKQIRSTERKLNNERKKHEEDLPVLSEPQQDKQDDEIIAWMRRVMLIIPDVREEVRLCENTKEEFFKLMTEWAGIDGQIDEAQKKYEDVLQTRYSDVVKLAIQYLQEVTGKYTLLGTYQMVFDEAVAAFKEEHQIKAINGKYHRYGLYARLLFAMRYFGKTVGNTRFMCVDEGQDLSINEYKLIYDLNQRNIVFNIFGDTNQLMKPGRGISDWKVLGGLFAAEEYQLNENYRNTNQITRFCNSSFGMNVLQTGVDGASVREIPRKDLETELAGLNITTERIAILVPRGVQKGKYIQKDLLPARISSLIGDKMDNGTIALMYVDEVKGIEFDKAYVVANKMSRNEKYIAYTRALSELVLVVDEKVEDYDDGSRQVQKKKTVKSKKKAATGTLSYEAQTSELSTEENTVADNASASVLTSVSVEEKPVSPEGELQSAPAEAAENAGNENITAEEVGNASETPQQPGVREPEISVESAPLKDPLAVLPKEVRKLVKSVHISGIEGEYYLIPYNGKLRNFTVKKAVPMFIPQTRSGKEMKVPVSVVEEDRFIFVTKENYKMHEKSFLSAEELELLL